MASADRIEEAARRKREAEQAQAAARAKQAAQQKAENEARLAAQRKAEREAEAAAERKLEREAAARATQAAQQRAENEARLAAQRAQEANLQRVREAEAAKERARQEEIRIAALRKAAQPAPVPTPVAAPSPAPVGGTADMREAAARAALENISIAEAKKEIEKDVRASNAITGAAGGAPTGMTADRAELQQIMDIYGVSGSEAAKIRNTLTDLGRVNAGSDPIYKDEEKVSKIPTPRVASSGVGSPAAGWQPSGPVSSVTGQPLFPGLENVDASKVTTPGDQTGDTGGTTPTPTPTPTSTPTPVPTPVPTPTPTAPVAPAVQQQAAPQQAALSAMTSEGGSSRTGLRLTPTSRGRAEVKSTTPFMRQPQAEKPGRSLFASSRRYTPSYWANEVRR